MKKRRLLYVCWHDAWSHPESGWKMTADVEKMGPAIAHSVGWELRRTKKHLILAAHLLEDDQCDGEVRIPLGMIVKEQELLL